MSVPVRMNTVKVQISQLSTASSYIDPNFRSPMTREVYNQVIEINAQVNFKRIEDQQFNATGDRDDTYGHICVSRVELASKSLTDGNNNPTIRKGDRKIKIESMPVDYEVVEVRPQAHLNNQANTYHIFFSENKVERGGPSA